MIWGDYFGFVYLFLHETEGKQYFFSLYRCNVKGFLEKIICSRIKFIVFQVILLCLFHSICCIATISEMNFDVCGSSLWPYGGTDLPII